MSAELLRQAAEAERAEWGAAATRRTYPKASAIHLAIADLLDEFAEAHDWCAERWVDADEAAVEKVWGYGSVVDLARLIVGEQ